MSGPLVVLGPQRPNPNVGPVLRSMGGTGPIVALTAGWRYYESELDVLEHAIGEKVVHLPLYQWFDDITERHIDLNDAWRARQDRILEFKRLYELRLGHAVTTVREILVEYAREPDLVRPDLDAAIEVVRRIDAHFLERIADLGGVFPTTEHPWRHPGVSSFHDEARKALEGARAVLIPGGHVGVLRNRLRFFGFEQLLYRAHKQGTAIVAWSAGAMALSSRVVLFYDDPPEGPSDPEVFDTGMGLLPGIVALPHARRRLRLDDPHRVAVMAARFAPHVCLGLENGAHLSWNGQWVSHGPEGTAFQLQIDGSVQCCADSHGNIGRLW
jgi:hypothetical protein